MTSEIGTPGGRHAWLAPSLLPCALRGSILFVHAGLCDEAAAWLAGLRFRNAEKGETG